MSRVSDNRKNQLYKHVCSAFTTQATLSHTGLKPDCGHRKSRDCSLHTREHAHTFYVSYITLIMTVNCQSRGVLVVKADTWWCSGYHDRTTSVYHDWIAEWYSISSIVAEWPEVHQFISCLLCLQLTYSRTLPWVIACVSDLLLYWMASKSPHKPVAFCLYARCTHI